MSSSAEDLLTDTKPEDKPDTKPEDKPDTKPEDKPEDTVVFTQNNWRDAIDKELQTNKFVLEQDNLSKLATDYIRLRQLAESDTSVKPVAEDAPFDSHVETSKNVFNVSEKSYTEEESLSDTQRELGLKYALSPKLLGAYTKELTEKEVLDTKDSIESKVTADTAKVLEVVPKDKLKTRFQAGLKALGLTFEQYKEALPVDRIMQPELVLAISKLGEKQFTSKQQEIIEGKDKELSDNPEILRAQIVKLTKERMNAVLSRQPYREIEKELKNIKLKYRSSVGKLNSGGSGNSETLEF